MASVNPQLLRAIRRRVPKRYQPLVLATALVESGGRLDAVGDNGQSFGPYQEYTGGRGAGLSPKQRMDPVGSTDRAWREFSSLAGRFQGPELAYRAQRPADHAGYVKKIAAALPVARQLLGSAPGAAMPGVPPAPGAPGAGDLAPVSGSLDVRRLMQIMAVQRQRVLNGVMPSPNYQRQIARLVQQAKSGADVKAAGQQVGAQAASGASVVADAAGTYGFPSGGVDSGRVYSGGTGGDWGGSMERALAVAKAVGMTPSSQKRSRKLTASGNPSDHWIGMPNSYAVDLPTSGAAGDAKFRELSKKLGIPLKAGVWNNVNIGGYRYQIGWRTPGHFDHIHVGVRKL